MHDDMPARRLARSLVLGTIAAMLCGPLSARAENHALIMWIGQYADPRANLPGIDLDAKAARRIAAAMGVPAANITELKNEQLTWRAMGQAITSLAARIKPGDKVFVYYSGHGGQQPNVSGGGHKCSEGLVAQDIQLYFDRDLETDLARLGAKASQVVMMNDSCFSGGASVKALGSLVPKAYPGPIGAPAGASGAGADYRCGDAVNKGMLTKNLEVIPRAGARLLYVAASADNEVSYAGPQGSLATQAWAACLEDPKADTDHSGSISGEELRACAQARVDHNQQHVSQHVTLTGTPSLPVSFATVAPAVATARVAADRVLQDIRAGADAAIGVTLKPARDSVRIGQDPLEFVVETQREGYLYILQVGSDGKSINVLFPNAVDADNHLAPGHHAFPRPSWALRAAGPAGADHLLALLSSEPKDFTQIGQRAGVFSSVPATRQGVKSLIVVSTGARAGSQGRYGTSEVMQVKEQP
jgi:hypothetical protein